MVEHERLREAALAGDVEQAVRLLTEHLHATVRAVQAVLDGRRERSTAMER